MGNQIFAFTLLGMFLIFAAVLFLGVSLITLALQVGPFIIGAWAIWMVASLIIGRPKPQS